MAVGNTFGATALSSYGGFWLSFAIILTPGGFNIQQTYIEEQGITSFYDAFGLFLMVSHLPPLCPPPSIRAPAHTCFVNRAGSSSPPSSSSLPSALPSPSSSSSSPSIWPFSSSASATCNATRQARSTCPSTKPAASLGCWRRSRPGTMLWRVSRMIRTGVSSIFVAVAAWIFCGDGGKGRER